MRKTQGVSRLPRVEQEKWGGAEHGEAVAGGEESSHQEGTHLQELRGVQGNRGERCELDESHRLEARAGDQGGVQGNGK